MTLKDEIIQFLLGELVGPRPGLPMVQLDGEEVLSPQDPPRLRYGAGILFPSARPLDDQEDDDADTANNASLAEEQDGESQVLEETTGEPHQKADKRGDTQSETDHELNRANETLPSALGVTVLVHLPEQIDVNIFAAQYEKVEIPGEGYTNKQGQWVPTPYWFRRKLDRVEVIDCRRLLDAVEPLEIPISTKTGGTKLALHIFSRSAKPSLPDAGDRDRFVTFTLINRTPGANKTSDEHCFFQCGLAVKASDGRPCFLEYPERRLDGSEGPEELGLLLLYRHRKIFAVGHGCSADWTERVGAASEVRSVALPVYEVAPILPVTIPGLDLEMKTLGEETGDEMIKLCQRLADGYEQWIEEQKSKVKETASVPGHLKQAAFNNISACTHCLGRIRAGIELLGSNPRARQAFALINRAMLMQHAHYNLATNHKRLWERSAQGLALQSRFETPRYSESGRTWRPFQIAFILMTLRSIVLDDPSDFGERAIVDLIWFPTGGGKTEAYLGLTAFTIFWRRLANPGNAGTAAIMRYTLRLLTTQQYQRAASLICACEKIRRAAPDELGSSPITIGLWVGGDVTPNSEKQAELALADLLKGESENPFIILSCPWCGAQMGPVRDGIKNTRQGLSEAHKAKPCQAGLRRCRLRIQWRRRPAAADY